MNLRALAHATSTTIVTITALTIIAELYSPLKDMLTKIGSHHWIGKSLIAVVVFGVTAFILNSLFKKALSEHTALYGTVVTTLGCALLLVGFFTFEFVR